MYSGYITTQKNVRKHSNADRLQVGECFGNQVIVSLDYTEGQQGVYFPSDGQQSVEFCEANNLLRKKDENGKNIGGYMDPDKRNVTAIRLRGEKSDGIFLPLSSLSSFGDVGSLQEGMKIDTFNGHLICKKYIPRTNGRGHGHGGNKTRKHAQKIAPLFQEHADTEQLAYNLDAFKPGDQIEITLKMHGCFAVNTRIRMADGSYKFIQKIQPGDSVQAYNFDKKSFEPSVVKNIFHNAPSGRWNKIKISRTALQGDNRGYLTATYNHPFWSEENQCWIEAQDLKPGMQISTLFPSYILTQMQKEIVAGSLLGDGCMQSYQGYTAELQNSVKLDHEQYIDYLVNIMGGYYYKAAQKYVSGYGTTMVRGRTHRSADLFQYFNQYITFSNKPGTRKLKDSFAECFTPLSLAIFYMEDGSLQHTDFQQDRASFAICDYNEEDASVIVKCFQKLGLEPVLYRDPKGYHRIRLNKDEAKKMFEMVAQWIPPVMRYKLPQEYRGNNFTPPVDPENLQQSYVLAPQVVQENIPLEGMRNEYDLETEHHNYVAGNCIVHNTSQRTAHLPVLKSFKRSLADRIFRRPGKPVYSYGYVSGTRRTVLEDYEGGYYGSNEFREQHSKFFEGKLWKGETVYYEIVGFVNDATPIMASADNRKTNDPEFVAQYGDTTVFSYGCEPSGLKTMYGRDDEGLFAIEIRVPQSDLYVYRMTMTNEDGDVVEYTPDFMRYRCEQMGAKTVPVLWSGCVPEVENDEALPEEHRVTPGSIVKDIAEQYYDGTDPIGKTHVREGVVVRIVNRPKFTAYKHKNWYFKCLSGIAMDTLANSGHLENTDDDIVSEM